MGNQNATYSELWCRNSFYWVFTKPDQAVIWRSMASKALNQMIFDANWGEIDFMLIDLPPGTGDIHLSIMQSLPITGLWWLVHLRQLH